MRHIHIDTLTESEDVQDVISWDCVVCGRARLCPYAAPCSSDAREACRSCGDLLAHLGSSSMAPRNGLNLEVM